MKVRITAEVIYPYKVDFEYEATHKPTLKELKHMVLAQIESTLKLDELSPKITNLGVQFLNPDDASIEKEN